MYCNNIFILLMKMSLHYRNENLFNFNNKMIIKKCDKKNLVPKIDLIFMYYENIILYYK